MVALEAGLCHEPLEVVLEDASASVVVQARQAHQEDGGLHRQTLQEVDT